MRVTFNTTFTQASHDLRRVTEELARRQREVSSGRRLSAPSDDPSAAAGAVRERSALAALDQYLRSADSARSRLLIVDSLLSDSISRLTAAQVSILSARGSSVTPVQREAAASELIGIRDALFSNLNSTFAGTFLFGGRSGMVPPLVTAPGGAVVVNEIDDTPIATDIGQGVSVQITFSVRAITDGAVDGDDLFTALDRAIAAVRDGDDAAMGDAARALSKAFERVTSVQSHVGTSMRAVDSHEGRVRELRIATDGRIAGYEQANLAEAISRMTQADTAYRAALGSIGAAGRSTLMDYLR